MSHTIPSRSLGSGTASTPNRLTPMWMAIERQTSKAPMFAEPMVTAVVIEASKSTVMTLVHAAADLALPRVAATCVEDGFVTAGAAAIVIQPAFDC
jgi:hypothetical protein